MIKLSFLMFLTILTSCVILKQSFSSGNEEELVISRKFAGEFIDYRYTSPEDIAGPHIIWIKTSLENLYGKISAKGKKCDFRNGERLYIKRTFYNPGIGQGYWVYFIENDSGISYEVTEFQHDRNYPVENIFQSGF